MGAERFIRSEDDNLETAIRTYVLEDKNLTIDLVGVIHIGDDKYYKRVKRFLNKEDMVLYEGVGLFPTSNLRIFKIMKSIMRELMYRTPAAFLGLESQNDGINYEKLPDKWKNVDFRIDDTIRTLEDKVRESKEKIGKNRFVKRMMGFVSEKIPKDKSDRMREGIDGVREFMEDMNREYPTTMNEAKKILAINNMVGDLVEEYVSQSFKVVRAFADDINRNAPDEVVELKKTAAQAFGMYDALKPLSMINPVNFVLMQLLLYKRNDIVCREIDRIVDEESDKRIGIIYGAMHMMGIEDYMKELGFTETKEKWLTAWDCGS